MSNSPNLVPRTVIGNTPACTGVYIGSPSLVVLPDGRQRWFPFYRMGTTQDSTRPRFPVPLSTRKKYEQKSEESGFARSR